MILRIESTQLALFVTLLIGGCGVGCPDVKPPLSVSDSRSGFSVELTVLTAERPDKSIKALLFVYKEDVRIDFFSDGMENGEFYLLMPGDDSRPVLWDPDHQEYCTGTGPGSLNENLWRALSHTAQGRFFDPTLQLEVSNGDKWEVTLQFEEKTGKISTAVVLLNATEQFTITFYDPSFQTDVSPRDFLFEPPIEAVENCTTNLSFSSFLFAQ